MGFIDLDANKQPLNILLIIQQTNRKLIVCTRIYYFTSTLDLYCLPIWLL